MHNCFKEGLTAPCLGSGSYFYDQKFHNDTNGNWYREIWRIWHFVRHTSLYKKWLNSVGTGDFRLCTMEVSHPRDKPIRDLQLPLTKSGCLQLSNPKDTKKRKPFIHIKKRKWNFYSLFLKDSNFFELQKRERQKPGKILWQHDDHWCRSPRK